MAETDASFGGLVVPPKVPVFTDDTVVEEYLKEIEKHLKKVSGVIGEVGLAIETSFQVDQSRIINLTVTNLWADNIITDDLVIGSNDNIRLNGVTLFNIEVWDNQATPVRRAMMGKFGAGNTQWGFQAWDASGSLKFQVGDTTFIDGAIISNATILSAAIFDMDGNKLQDDSVPDGKIINIEYSKIDNVLITESDIDVLAVTETKIGVLSVTNSKIGLLAVSNTEIANTTIATGKHAANAITDAELTSTGQVTWGVGDTSAKTLVNGGTFATGGEDVYINFGASIIKNTEDNGTLTIRMKRDTTVIRTFFYKVGAGVSNVELSLVYIDQGASGDHSYDVTATLSLAPSGTSVASDVNTQVVWILKT